MLCAEGSDDASIDAYGIDGSIITGRGAAIHQTMPTASFNVSLQGKRWLIEQSYTNHVLFLFLTVINMKAIEEMSTAKLTEIARRIWNDMETIENLGFHDDPEIGARYAALQLTYDTIDAELGEREAAAKWHAEQQEYAWAMVRGC